MYWIIVFSITILGDVVQILFFGSTGFTTSHIAEVRLVWLLAGFYSVATLLAGCQHLFNSNKIANYIG